MGVKTMNDNHRLTGILSSRSMSKRNNGIKAVARYIIKKGEPCSVAECYANMTNKKGTLYRSSKSAVTQRQLESRINRHPIFKKYDTKPRTYTCTLEQYISYFQDDDPFFNYYDTDSEEVKTRRNEYARRKRNEENQ